MQLAFRIECPHCGYGFKWKNRYINQGWLGCTCENNRCQKKFVVKLTVREVKIQIEKELPEGQVCNSKLTSIKGNDVNKKYENESCFTPGDEVVVIGPNVFGQYIHQGNHGIILENKAFNKLKIKINCNEKIMNYPKSSLQIYQKNTSK